MKRETAYKIAIKAIEIRQRYWWTGHLEFLKHGDRFEFAVRDHRNWEKLERAKEILVLEMDQEQLKMEL